ncbi:hypothetical protein SCOCK_120155 [Actinacidiphila cocklensis]|uniref:Uncharacterized protein n=1 Tax=Actinacidiphila cocklensis TaxID=887465 RepID=A0A9W4DK26_9ACTN|nr:hypothetical protein SCOCK_120155 [Actinacidiphila cocklensis]
MVSPDPPRGRWGRVLTRPPGRSRQPWRHTGTQPVCLPLVIGPVDRRKGPSREIEQANTHNEP